MQIQKSFIYLWAEYMHWRLALFLTILVHKSIHNKISREFGQFFTPNSWNINPESIRYCTNNMCYQHTVNTATEYNVERGIWKINIEIWKPKIVTYHNERAKTDQKTLTNMLNNHQIHKSRKLLSNKNQ